MNVKLDAKVHKIKHRPFIMSLVFLKPSIQTSLTKEIEDPAAREAVALYVYRYQPNEGLTGLVYSIYVTVLDIFNALFHQSTYSAAKTAVMAAYVEHWSKAEKRLEHLLEVQGLKHDPEEFKQVRPKLVRQELPENSKLRTIPNAAPFIPIYSTNVDVTEWVIGYIKTLAPEDLKCLNQETIKRLIPKLVVDTDGQIAKQYAPLVAARLEERSIEQNSTPRKVTVQRERARTITHKSTSIGFDNESLANLVKNLVSSELFNPDESPAQFIGRVLDPTFLKEAVNKKYAHVFQNYADRAVAKCDLSDECSILIEAVKHIPGFGEFSESEAMQQLLGFIGRRYQIIPDQLNLEKAREILQKQIPHGWIISYVQINNYAEQLVNIANMKREQRKDSSEILIKHLVSLPEVLAILDENLISELLKIENLMGDATQLLPILQQEIRAKHPEVKQPLSQKVDAFIIGLDDTLKADLLMMELATIYDSLGTEKCFNEMLQTEQIDAFVRIIRARVHAKSKTPIQVEDATELWNELIPSAYTVQCARIPQFVKALVDRGSGKEQMITHLQLLPADAIASIDLEAVKKLMADMHFDEDANVAKEVFEAIKSTKNG